MSRILIIEELVGAVNAVDSRWAGAIAPGQTAIVGHYRSEVATSRLSMIRRTREIEAVSIGLAAVGPVDRVVNLAVVARLKTIRPSAATVP
ncbi:MAG: hypothetical protein J2P17_09205, partial [Mycobacterium sp.]|nr:hypothetical protein [Mycobacterium sp.]